MKPLKTITETLLAYDSVEKFQLLWDDHEQEYTLTLVLRNGDTPADGLQVKFLGVHGLNLTQFGGGLTQFTGLMITKCDKGWDRVRYEISQVEDGTVSFYCRDIRQ